MEKHDEADVARWTEDRMATLSPDAEWEPNEVRGLARLREARDRVRARRRGWTWIAVGATATLVLMVTPMARAFAERCGEFVMRSLYGPAPSRAYVSPEQRRVMPDFTLNDASGHPVTLSDFRGKVVLLNFWTTSCPQCDGEIPWFNEFQRTYGDELVVLGVSLDKDGWASAGPYVEARRINYRVMVGGDEVVRQYGSLRSIPTTLIIDKSGRIAVTHVGFCTKSEYEADTNALLAEQ
jgi:peroxiredoxin